MTTAEWLDLGAVMVGVAGFGGLIYQVRADHTRRRRQATLDFYTSTLEVRHGLKQELPPDRDTAAVRNMVKRVLADPDAEAETLRTIVRYLGYHELLATAVLDGVFDEHLIKRLARTRILAVLDGYGPFIHSRRERFDNPDLYCDIERLAQRWTDQPVLGAA